MKMYQFSDFDKNDAWLMFRFDVKVANDFLDMYLIMHLPSGFIMGQEIITHDVSELHLKRLFKQCAQRGRISGRLLLAKNDPAGYFINTVAEQYSMQVEMVPAASLDLLLSDIRQSFAAQFPTTSGLGYQQAHDDDIDPESAKKFIPDSYDPCPCASGKKYKFCCKQIFEEIISAMVAAEKGNQQESIKWIEQAKERVGETGEVLCREAIVYSFFDKKKSKELLDKCLKLYPHHPRAHYLHAIELIEKGDFHGGVISYNTAIQHYPETAHFHLNEVYNNLGTAYYHLNDLANAKMAWEKALLYLPSDKVTQDNLREFIYRKQDTIF